MKEILYAFPTPDSFDYYSNRGMTLRDYFAGQALTGIMANIEYLKLIDETKAGQTISFNCYEIADAMLKQREA